MLKVYAKWLAGTADTNEENLCTAMSFVTGLPLRQRK